MSCSRLATTEISGDHVGEMRLRTSIREAASGVADPDTVAFLITAISAGIAMKDAMSLPLPDAERLRATLLALLLNLLESNGCAIIAVPPVVDEQS